jgi:hypothetical protein
VKDIRKIGAIDGVGFEYMAGDEKKKGIDYDKAKKKWFVKNRSARFLHVVPRVADGVSAFLHNMAAAGMPVEKILIMGTYNCRCVSGSSKLSAHSIGDAIDIGGVRLTSTREILVANSECDPEDRKILHRINACARLSFATVFDYHDRMPKPTHWNHFHCDTNEGGPRTIGASKKAKYFHRFGFIRESLGLPWNGGWDKTVADALRSFAGPMAVKDADSLRRAIGYLCLREANRTQPDRAPRYKCKE